MKKSLTAVRTAGDAAFMAAVNSLRVGSTVIEAGTVTIDGRVYEIDTTHDATITAGRVRIDCHTGTAAAQAVGTLTLTDVPHADNTTIVGSKTYTWKASPTTTANEVKIGASAEASIDNLVAAINGGTGSGTLYGSATVASTEVVAVKATAATMTVTAIVPGTAGNSLSSAGTMTHGSWGGANLASGADCTGAQFATALAATLNADEGSSVWALVGTGAEVVVWARSPKSAAAACSLSFVDGSNLWVSATLYGGDTERTGMLNVAAQRRTVLATEATAAKLYFVFGFTPTAVVVQAEASGVLLLLTGWGAAISGRKVTVTGSGGVALATGQIVTVLAFR